jgi:hypothetical protein
VPLELFFGSARLTAETFVEAVLDLFGRCEVAMPARAG